MKNNLLFLSTILSLFICQTAEPPVLIRRNAIALLDDRTPDRDIPVAIQLPLLSPDDNPSPEDFEEYFKAAKKSILQSVQAGHAISEEALRIYDRSRIFTSRCTFTYPKKNEFGDLDRTKEFNCDWLWKLALLKENWIAFFQLVGERIVEDPDKEGCFKLIMNTKVLEKYKSLDPGFVITRSLITNPLPTPLLEKFIHYLPGFLETAV